MNHQPYTIRRLVAVAFERIGGVVISHELGGKPHYYPVDVAKRLYVHARTIHDFDASDLAEILGDAVFQCRLALVRIGLAPDSYELLPDVGFGMIFHWRLRIDGYPIRALMSYSHMAQGWNLTLDAWVH